MREIVDKAEAMTNPPDLEWQDLFTSRFYGAMPASITEVPRVLVLTLDSMRSEPDNFHTVNGSFEHSAEGVFASIRFVVGKLDLTTREFSLHTEGTGEQWIFAGTLSANGRVMHLRTTCEGYTTEGFPLVHADTFAQLIPA